MPFRFALSRMCADASSELSIAIVSRAVRRERERESAVIAETIEQASVRVAARRFAILALIEEQPGLLSREQIDVVAHASFVDLDVRRHLARHHFDLRVQSFEPAHASVVAREDAFRRDQLVEDARPLRHQPIGRLRQRLQRRGSRRSDRRRATAGGRLRRGRGDTRWRRSSATRGTRSPVRAGAATARRRRRARAGQHPQRDLRPSLYSAGSGRRAALRHQADARSASDRCRTPRRRGVRAGRRPGRRRRRRPGHRPDRSGKSRGGRTWRVRRRAGSDVTVGAMTLTYVQSPFYADCDWRRPCGLRAERSGQAGARRAAHPVQGFRHRVGRFGRLSPTMPRASPTRSRAASSIAASWSAAPASAWRWPPTRSAACAPRR